MDAFEQIKSISISEVLTALGIQFLKQWPTLSLYEWNRLTHWWRADMTENIVKDFTWKRAEWDRVTFVMKHLWLNSKSEVVEWYRREFWVTSDEIKKHEPIKPQPKMEQPAPMNPDVKTKWESLPPLNEKQREYVRSRWIDPEKVSKYAKDNNGWIAVAIYNESGIITIQNRNVDEKKFSIEKGTNSKGCFVSSINKDDKKVYVVEWMFDFLSLAQFWVNVIGMKSAMDGAELVRKFQSKGYEVTIVPDNDDAGRNMHALFDDMPHFWYDLNELGVKDVNEMLVKGQYGESILYVIDGDRTMAGPKPPVREYEIIDYESGLDDGLEELKETKIENVISWWITTLDSKLWYLMPGQLVLIGGVTGAGKSTFVNEIAWNVSKQWIKVWRFVLEDRHQDKRKNDLYYTVWRIRKLRWEKNYPKSEFMANNIQSPTFQSELKDARDMLVSNYRNILDVKANTQRQMKIEELWELIKDFISKWCKLIVIDHLHYFKITGDAQRYDLQIEHAMQYINALARDYNITIVLLAHYKKLNWERPNDESFKDSMSIAQVPNKVLHVHRDKMKEWLTELIVTKNREGWTWVIEMNFDSETHTYSNAKSALQTEREKSKFDFV